MRRILLTSGEVSILGSLAIVVVCTLALFFSGYVIQQRTLRDLRVAIQPREVRAHPPRAYLPDYFRPQQGSEGDGEAVSESEAEREAREMQQALAAKMNARPATPTPADVDKGDAAVAATDAGSSARQRAVVQELQAQVAAKAWGVEHPDPAKHSRIPVTRAERRRIIKEEIRRLAEGEKPVYYQRRLW
ncbi:hypothetical protein CDD82_3362 [Ophiocordyceps australis]|uniref:Uncharacterized protein n=1 Tax=Ophiocordyceps australis TaxID=1399860 RepID=A0A2C5Z7H5_9HYPO|nr:hypothetical protein CDD82_3362 [Ophiocordyceps australis]